ncbi:MAG: MaoC family dehydratase [Rhodospirillaceae bacterium]|nr:MaoC family dehydratase [Rhodospirillaceae bacterium]
MKPRYFEDFAVGDRIVTPGITLTEGNIIDFAMRYDPQPIHVDAVAAGSGFYGGIIASGWQLTALAFRMLWQSGFIYGGSLGSPGVDELKWLKPVRPGDTISVEAEVIGARLSAKGGRGYLTVVYTVKNQNGDAVMTMKGAQIMALRPAA